MASENLVKRLFYSIVLVLSLCQYVKGQDCEIEGMDPFDWTTGFRRTILDNTTGEIFRSKTTNIKRIISVTPDIALNEGPYIDVVMDVDEVVFSVSSMFSNYEENEIVTSIATNINFECERSNRQLLNIMTITDTNNNDPKILPDSLFNYTIFTPVVANFPISMLFGDIIVRDIDLTNTAIIPKMTPNDFLTLEYLRVDANSRKNHFLDLRTSRVIASLQEPVTIEFTVTDVDTTGDPRRTAIGTIIIQSDPTTEFPVIPMFEDAFYKGVYQDDAVVFEKNMKLSQGYDDDIVFALTGENSEYFNVSYTGNEVTITVNFIPENVIQNTVFMLFALTATNNGVTGSSAIHVEFKKDHPTDIERPLFESTFYSGKFENATLTFDYEIKLSQGYSADVEFYLEGDSAIYFDFTDNNNNIIIFNKTSIPEEVIDITDFLIFGLVATIKNLTTSTAITVAFPKEIVNIMFDKPSYEGEYSKENILTHQSIVLSSGFSDKISFSLDEESNMYFEITNENENVFVKTKLNLPDDFLIKNSFFNVIIKATDDFNVAFATLTVKLPENDIQKIRFNEPSYIGEYSNENILSHTDIILEIGYSDKISFSLDEESDKYFEITNNRENIFINTKLSLPDDILKTNSFFNIILKATDGFNMAFTTLTVNLPENEINSLKFQSPSYEGRYTDEHTLIHPNIILEEGYNNRVIFTLEEEAKNNFDISNTEGIVTITIRENLPEEIISSLKFYNMIITATMDSNKAFTTLTLDFPGTATVLNILKFSDPFYIGVYEETGEVTHPIIRLSEGYHSGVVFGIEGELSNYFEVTFLNEVVRIIAKDKLPQEVIDSRTYIPLVILANAIGSESGFTTISIDLPAPEHQSLMRFGYPSYQGTYDEDHKVTHPEIQLETGFNTNVTFELEEMAAVYFDINNDLDKVTITTKTDLPSHILETNSFLNIIIIARNLNLDSAYTTLTLSLTSGENCSVPLSLSFSQQLYTGYYSIEHELTHPEIRISQGYNTGVVYSIQGDMHEYFNVDPLNEVVKIIVRHQLPQRFLDENTFLNLIVWARSIGSNSAFTSLSVELPEKEILVMKFAELFYEGFYNEDHTITHTAIILESGYSSSVTFSLEADANLYFTISNVNNRVTIGRKVNLPQDVLDSNNFLNLVVWAKDRSSVETFTTLTLSLPGDGTVLPPNILRFALPNYLAEYTADHRLLHPEISLVDGYIDSVVYSLEGDMKDYFEIHHTKEVVTVVVKTNIPEEMLSTNSYVVLVIWAKAVGSLSGTTILNIDLPNISEIGEFPSLTVVRIDENKEYEDLLATFNVDCDYEITDSWPENQIWFTIENRKLSCTKVDRENETIAFLPKSQVQLELTCRSSDDRFQNLPNSINNPREDFINRLTKAPVCELNTDNRNWIYTGHIHETPNKRLVSILVEDENDNRPLFNTIGTLMIGYPNHELATFIRPVSLTTVIATDLDICVNADIRYSTFSEYFTIHPKSGAIYPKNNALNDMGDPYTFKVTATDRNGLGNPTDLNIQVKLLDLDQVAFLHIEDALIENSESIIAEISEKLQIQVNALTSFMLPFENDGPRNVNDLVKSRLELRLDDVEDASLGIFIYAFDINNDLLGATELLSLIRENIDDSDIDWSLEGIPLSESILYDLRLTENDNLGLIIAVSVVSGLLILLIIGIVVWFIVIMPKKYRRFADSYSSSAGSVASNDDNEEEDEKDDTSSDKEVTLAETVVAEPYKNALTFVDETPPPETKKAGVTFKETVQQIDILNYGEEEEEGTVQQETF